MKKINDIQDFLVICSGASPDLISQCPEYEKIKYSSIGATILLTSVFAFISSLFCLSLIFHSFILVLVLSVFWAMVIFNLDRYIVQSLGSFNTGYQLFCIALPRLVLAVFIGVLISKPLEVKLFENEITSFLELAKSEKISESENGYALNIDLITSQRFDCEERFEAKLKLREKYYEDYICECNGTCGTRKRGRGIECEARKNKYETYLIEIEKERLLKEIRVKQLHSTQKKLQDKLESEIEIIKSSSSDGFFSRVNALNEVGNLSSVFILMIFILIETAPIITKLIVKEGPYENLVMQCNLEFQTDLLKIRDLSEMKINKFKKLNIVSTELEFKSEETKIKDALREKTLAKYEQIRKENQHNYLNS